MQKNGGMYVDARGAQLSGHIFVLHAALPALRAAACLCPSLHCCDEIFFKRNNAHSALWQ
jgi:hypothetical protein